MPLKSRARSTEQFKKKKGWLKRVGCTDGANQPAISSTKADAERHADLRATPRCDAQLFSPLLVLLLLNNLHDGVVLPCDEAADGKEGQDQTCTGQAAKGRRARASLRAKEVGEKVRCEESQRPFRKKRVPAYNRAKSDARNSQVARKRVPVAAPAAMLFIASSLPPRAWTTPKSNEWYISAEEGNGVKRG